METNTAECKVIDQIYNAAANPEGVNTLRAYQARGDRWHRLTEREADDTKAKRLRDRAELVRAKIEATQARAALVVIRRRMNRALTGFVPILLALLFVAGLLAFGLGADRLDSERTTRLAAYKACAEAFTAKVPATKLPALQRHRPVNTGDAHARPGARREDRRPEHAVQVVRRHRHRSSRGRRDVRRHQGSARRGCE